MRLSLAEPLLVRELCTVQTADVDQGDLQDLVRRIDQDVVGVQVPMLEPVLVHELQNLRNLIDDLVNKQIPRRSAPRAARTLAQAVLKAFPPKNCRKVQKCTSDPRKPL